MKLSKWIFGTALLLSAQMASVQGAGYSSCDPCDPCYENPCDICDIDFCDVEYAFSVDALYWEICRSDLDVGSSDGKEEYLNPGFHWGYRLIGTARWNCWDLGFRYTSLCAEDSKRQPFGNNDKVTFELDFDVLDIELGYTCCLDCGLVFRPFLGAKLAWIDDDLKVVDDIAGLGDFSKIDFDGYGLYIGTSMRWELTKYCLCEREIPIALVARASAGVLRGDFEHDAFLEESEQNRDHHCILIPVQEYYAGLDFTFCDLCGWDAFFQLGYEAQYWGWREYFNDADTAHLGLHGLVLRFGASF